MNSGGSVSWHESASQNILNTPVNTRKKTREKNRGCASHLRSWMLFLMFIVHGFLCQVAVGFCQAAWQAIGESLCKKSRHGQAGIGGIYWQKRSKKVQNCQLGKDWNRFKQRRKTSEFNLHNVFLRGIEAKSLRSLRSCIVKDQCGYHPAWSEQRRSAWLGIYRTSQIMTWASTALSLYPLIPLLTILAMIFGEMCVHGMALLMDPFGMQNSTKKLMANGVRYISTGSRVFVHQSFAGQENLRHWWWRKFEWTWLAEIRFEFVQTMHPKLRSWMQELLPHDPNIW